MSTNVKENPLCVPFLRSPLPGGRDLSRLWPERLSEFHPPAPTGTYCRTVHGSHVRVALLVGSLRVSARRRSTAASQLFRTVRGGRARAGARQHSQLPRFDVAKRLLQTAT